METIRIAICDDDDNIMDIMLSAVRTAFEKHGVSVDIETFNSAETLSRSMKKIVFDLVFLDIEMPRLDGIAFGQQLRRSNDKTEIVYVSAREDRVFEAFKIRPLGFVRKSNFLGDLSAVVNGYIKMLGDRRGNTITVQSKSGIMNVPLISVTYFEGCGKYQLMYLDGRKEAVQIYRSMEKLGNELAEKGFIRIHKGLLVNFRFISRILVGSVELVGGEELPMSRRKAVEIKERYLYLLKNSGSIML